MIQNAKRNQMTYSTQNNTWEVI